MAIRSKWPEVFTKGQTIGKFLTVTGAPFVRKTEHGKYWGWVVPVKCHCGKEFSTSCVLLNNGRTISCGCEKRRRHVAFCLYTFRGGSDE